MKTSRIYYVCDPIMESIIGSFAAPSLDAAKVIFKKSVIENEKFKSYDHVDCYAEPQVFETAETYSEVVDACGKVDLYDIVD